MVKRWIASVGGRRGRRGAGCRLSGTLACLAVMAAAGAALGDAGPPVGTFELRPSPEALPPLPPPAVFPVQLVLDDDQQEGAFGVAGAGGARQFLWFNRFALPPGGIHLEEIWVLFPGGANMTVGGAVDLVVFQDPDGDPTNGADLVTSFSSTIQAVDDVTFSVYPLPAPTNVTGSGDVLIGVVPRFVVSGVTGPTSPAALDLTASAGRSWFATWAADPPDPPLLPPDQLITRIDDFDPQAAGNWMIRGFGSQPAGVEVPTLGGAGLALLAGLLALAALPLLWRRRVGP
jgi:hypothetical protein